MGDCTKDRLRRRGRMAKGATWQVGAVRRLIVAGLVSVVLGSFAVTAEAFAQAGSAGGTIGKTGKSQSGSLEAPSVRREPQARTQARPPRAVTVSSCSKMPGSWSWFNGGTVVIRPDGTASGGRHSATWSCTNGAVVMHWSHGYTDRLRLSGDGSHLEGTNGFVTVSGNRN